MPSANVIDPEAIENLRALTPEDPDSFLRDIIEIFLDDTPARLADLRKSLAENDRPTFTRAAHSIKGSASNLGAIQLRAISSELEQRGKSETVADLGTRVADLEAAFAQVREELLQLVKPV